MRKKEVYLRERLVSEIRMLDEDINNRINFQKEEFSRQIGISIFIVSILIGLVSGFAGNFLHNIIFLGAPINHYFIFGFTALGLILLVSIVFFVWHSINLKKLIKITGKTDELIERRQVLLKKIK